MILWADDVKVHFGGFQGLVAKPFLDPGLGYLVDGRVDAVRVAQTLGAGLYAGDLGGVHDNPDEPPAGGAAERPHLRIPAMIGVILRPADAMGFVELRHECAGYGDRTEMAPLVFAPFLEASDDDRAVIEIEVRSPERQRLAWAAACPKDGLAEAPLDRVC